MSSLSLILLILVYFGLLFFLASYVENRKPNWADKAWVYALSLGVYCTAWTFYGSVGVAATSGMEFLTIYLGPIIAAPLWLHIMTKVFRISQVHKVSSIADFLSLRYGGSKRIGTLVTLICLLAIIPYISLQLKAVAETFKLMTEVKGGSSFSFWDDSTFYIAILLAFFATFFGVRGIDTTEQRRGMVVSLAFESVLKLVLFLVVGVWICFFLYDGTADIFGQMHTSRSGFSELYTFSSLTQSLDWFFMIALSFMAIFLLPRQFHVSVVELTQQKFIKSAIWIFPLYLLLFNVLVIFVAWVGLLQFGDTAQADYFALLIPMRNGQKLLTVLSFFGGFSAAISMVVVSTLSLSIMLSNNVLIPFGFIKRLNEQDAEHNIKQIIRIRRISVFLIIIAAYLFYVMYNVESDLFSIGLTAFLIIAQLSPSFFAGLYWNRGSARGAFWGIVAGMSVVLITLLFPALHSGEASQVTSMQLSRESLQSSFLDFSFLSPIPNALYWSLLTNGLVYATVSLMYKGDYRERNYAELFVNNRYYENLQDEAFVWKGEAYVKDIQQVLAKFLGASDAERAIDLFHKKYKLPRDTQIADARLISFSEKLLTGRIGATSTRILINNVVKEQSISLVEVLNILDESKKTVDSNKLLKEKSEQLTALSENLKNLNAELKLKDQQKDEFLDTIAHELKTPITAIKASAELLSDEEDNMPAEMQAKFLETIVAETDRISRLITNILNFEKLDKGRQHFVIENHNIHLTAQKSIDALSTLIQSKDTIIQNHIPVDMRFDYDEDQMQQVFTNILSNAIKYTPEENGSIRIEAHNGNQELKIQITDNGLGIKPEDADFIFDKFFQSKNQNTKKPKGSGLGLAICKSIVESHGGTITLNKNQTEGAQFIIKIPTS